MIRDRRGGAAGMRQLRVAEAVRHALSQILSRQTIRDDDLAGVSVTVSEVTISPDLKQAMAFVVPLGGDNTELVVAALNRNARWLRGQVAASLPLRHSPVLGFRADTGFAQAVRIGDKLRALDVPPADQDEPEDPDGTPDGT